MAISALLNAFTAPLQVLVPTAKVFIGAEFLADTSAIAPRLVWVPLNSIGDGAEAHQVNYPRALHTRMTYVEAHIWGKSSSPAQGADFDACESLLQSLVQVLRATLAAAYKYVGDRWGDQVGGSLSQYGRELIATFAFPTPIVDDTSTQVLVVPVTEAQTGEMDFPNGNIVSGSPTP